jgi:hypothetical protein
VAPTEAASITFTSQLQATFTTIEESRRTPCIIQSKHAHGRSPSSCRTANARRPRGSTADGGIPNKPAVALSVAHIAS